MCAHPVPCERVQSGQVYLFVVTALTFINDIIGVHAVGKRVGTMLLTVVCKSRKRRVQALPGVRIPPTVSSKKLRLSLRWSGLDIILRFVFKR